MSLSTGLESSVEKDILHFPGVELKPLGCPAHRLRICGTTQVPLSSPYFSSQWRLSPLSGHGLPDLLPPTFSLPCRGFTLQICSKYRASLQTASTHLPIGFLTGLLPPKYFFYDRILVNPFYVASPSQYLQA